MTRRRDVSFALLGAGTWLSIASAQQTRRIARLGILGQNPPDEPAAAARYKWVADGLRALGWEEGRNLHTEIRWGRLDMQHLEAAARELVAAQVNAIYTVDDSTTHAAWRATRTIPIVMFGTAAVEPGYAQSLARPGGNVTGVVWQNLDAVGKELTLLRLMRPDLARVGLFAAYGEHPIADQWLHAWRAAAAAQGIGVVALPDVKSLAGIEPMLAAAARADVQALTMPVRNFLLGEGMRRINDWAIPRRALVSAGYARGEVLLGFGLDGSEVGRVLFAKLDRVLRGEPPADIPIEQPTRFSIVINQRIARAMRLTLPPALLLQATEVVE